ncbi:hypothetical protein BCV70DRAFT_87251 [Testicularia cyperi]|uniref:Uncharacterized protein n=1 Tax=Testicularia cyperi TaxID=1882483 RepID=A0A317XRP8_9BASI|nr:hypothetical protein BCV70DRAFT_87251 [Testicularia cyperi]
MGKRTAGSVLEKDRTGKNAERPCRDQHSKTRRKDTWQERRKEKKQQQQQQQRKGDGAENEVAIQAKTMHRGESECERQWRAAQATDVQRRIETVLETRNVQQSPSHLCEADSDD